MKRIEIHKIVGERITRTMELFKLKAVLGPGSVFGVFWTDKGTNDQGIDLVPLEKQKWHPTQSKAHRFIRSLRKEVKIHESIG